MVLSGKLKAFHGPKTDGNYFWSFQKYDIEQFMKWVTSKCKVVNKRSKGFISFKEANFAIRHIDIDTIALIEMVANGDLPAIMLKNEQNIKGIYISEKAIIHICETEKEKRIENFGYTLSEASHILKVDVRKIKRWVQLGKLPIKHKKQNENGTMSYFLDIKMVEKMLEGKH